MNTLARDQHFILQQGLNPVAPESASTTYSALLFQPRIVGVIALVGTIVQSPALFSLLAAALLWSAIFPRWNPFNALYNILLSRRTGVRLGPAPPPRRFAEGMAGGFAALIAFLLVLEWHASVLFLEFLFLVALAALVFAGFCIGSFIYHAIHEKIFGTTAR